MLFSDSVYEVNYLRFSLIKSLEVNVYLYNRTMLVFFVKIPMFTFHLWLPRAHVRILLKFSSCYNIEGDNHATIQGKLWNGTGLFTNGGLTVWAVITFYARKYLNIFHGDKINSERY